MGFPTQILAFVVIDFSYLLFHTCFYPRRESATFLLATMPHIEDVVVDKDHNGIGYGKAMVHHLLHICTLFGLHDVEQCFENALWNVCPTFQNLRSGRVTLHRRAVLATPCRW
jgi:GNAT superfamily N-acetyltransferase